MHHIVGPVAAGRATQILDRRREERQQQQLYLSGGPCCSSREDLAEHLYVCEVTEKTFLVLAAIERCTLLTVQQGALHAW